MRYINGSYSPVPEAEAVIADYNINFILPDDLFQPEMFGKNVKEKNRDFQQK